MELDRFAELPILGIVRGISAAQLEPLVETVISAGLRTIEITMNTEGAAVLIRTATAVSGGRLTIGAGTVLTRRDLEAALGAGARFIVMPTLVPEVMEYCTGHAIPVFPGALTPQEIYSAWRAGASMVKVFPAGFFGPAYFKELRGPFQDIPLLACGGVTPENMQAYFDNGAAAISFGERVFRKEWLVKGDFTAIGASIKEYLNAYRLIRQGPNPL